MYPSQFVDEIPAELLQNGGTGRQTAGHMQSGEKEGSYKRGMRVFHDEYGHGTVRKSIMSDFEETVEVVFDSGRNGTFVPEFTPLEKIADDEFA